ncbi:normocyte binding protein 2b [Candidatus Francisella endociliophora]|uniref:normocyte binding protein 2b n=1 Tax=Candidatus Francisella endociliophora TaxID=653937 RepID=UPI000A6921E6|nr:normocyte binding protein 2b [Francisella sp. FSC1006]
MIIQIYNSSFTQHLFSGISYSKERLSNVYYTIKQNQGTRVLLSIIGSNYNSDNKNSIQEVNLEHVLNRIPNDDVKVLVKNAWKDLELIVGQEVRLLENNCKKSFINRFLKKTKNISFIIKSQSNKDTTLNPSFNNIKLEKLSIEL